MTIEEFMLKHGATTLNPINTIIDEWVLKKEVEEFLETSVCEGVLIVDILINPEIRNEGISKELLQGFSGLMKDKADTIDKVRDQLLEKFHRNHEAFQGLLNKIQGQIGENQFARQFGKLAELAPSGRQEGWDVVVHHSTGDQFVQVKVYHDAHAVVALMKENAAKVAAGQIHFGTTTVHHVDFAVNDDIYQHVKQLSAAQHIHTHVLNIQSTHDHIQSLFEQAGHRIASSDMHNFFHDLFNGVVVGAGLVAAVNGFLLWKRAKDRDTALEDTIYGTAIIAGGLAAVLTSKAILISRLRLALGTLAGPAGFIGILGIGMGAREVLKRFSNRRYLARNLMNDNDRLRDLCTGERRGFPGA
jgi:hypothetical protein